jgi:hypothetical protein
METKLIAMIVGVALVLATTATVYTQSALAVSSSSTGSGGSGTSGASGAAGTTDGQVAHGLATACSHSHAAEHNPHCGGQTPTGDVKPVEGWVRG